MFNKAKRFPKSEASIQDTKWVTLLHWIVVLVEILLRFLPIPFCHITVHYVLISIPCDLKLLWNRSGSLTGSVAGWEEVLIICSPILPKHPPSIIWKSRNKFSLIQRISLSLFTLSPLFPSQCSFLHFSAWSMNLLNAMLDFVMNIR